MHASGEKQVARLTLRRWWSTLIIALLVLAWFRFNSYSRLKILGRGDVTGGPLRMWWTFLVATHVFWFALMAVGVIVLVRTTKKRPAKYLWVVFLGNAFVIWFLFGLAAIASDPILQSALTPIGLSALGDWLYGVASLWVVFFLYVLFSAIDASPGGVARPLSKDSKTQ